MLVVWLKSFPIIKLWCKVHILETSTKVESQSIFILLRPTCLMYNRDHLLSKSLFAHCRSVINSHITADKIVISRVTVLLKQALGCLSTRPRVLDKLSWKHIGFLSQKYIFSWRFSQAGKVFFLFQKYAVQEENCKLKVWRINIAHTY